MNKPITKKALVTGATGFIGSHLVRRLIATGWETHLIVRSASNHHLLDKIEKYVTFHQHDGSTSSMLTIMERTKPTIVFHLASFFLSQHQSKDVESLIQSNILFATQLIEAMAVHGISRLVNTGTSWQHYENSEYNPVNLYAATKQAYESILTYYIEAGFIKAITLKLFDTYGPNDPRPKLFTLLRKVAREQQPLLMSPGEQLIDLVYVDDVINAFMIAATRLSGNQVDTHEAYAVTSGKPIKLKELVALYGHIIGKTLSIAWGGKPYRPREVMIPWDRGRSLPGWHPDIDLKNGIMLMEGLKT